MGSGTQSFPNERWSSNGGTGMSERNRPAVGGRPVRLRWGLAVAVLVVWAANGRAQSPAVAPLPPGQGLAGLIPSVNPGGPRPADPGVVQANCASCASPGGAPTGPGVHGYGHYPADGCTAGNCGSEGCGEAGCVPGRPPCVTCEGQNRVGRMLCAFHNALCCPDPCYEPRWTAGPNAALFVDYARPVTQTRIRWDSGQNVIQPDRAEYFWAAIGKKGPKKPETRVNYNELRFYQEAAADRFSFFIDMPYRQVNGAVNGGSGGFGDLILGTKTLLLDSELVQTTFQLTTSIPTGVPGRGIGVGHVSLDPSLLWAVKLYPDTYWQSQLGYVIPISGTPGFAGSILHYGNSINHVICRPLPDTAFIGSIESLGYTFTSGSYTNTNGAVLSANNQTYFGVGPGFRLSVCDKLDLGFGVLFSATTNRFADQLYRTELRWRF